MISQKSIRIPIADSSDFVEVFPDELPADVNDLLDVLKAEFAPLKIWRAAAVLYFVKKPYLTDMKFRLSITANSN